MARAIRKQAREDPFMGALGAVGRPALWGLVLSVGLAFLMGVGAEIFAVRVVDQRGIVDLAVRTAAAGMEGSPWNLPYNDPHNDAHNDPPASRQSR